MRFLDRPGRDRARPALAQLVDYHHPLDLAGALPDAVDAEVAVEALAGVLAHIAAAAEHLDAAIDYAARHLAGVELDLRGLGVDRLAVDPSAALPGHLVGQRPRR